MNVQQATATEAPEIAAVLQEAAQWLIDGGRPLWAVADFDAARIARDVEAGLFCVAHAGEAVAGVMKFEREDAYFWPEVAPAENQSTAASGRTPIGICAAVRHVARADVLTSEDTS